MKYLLPLIISSVLLAGCGGSSSSKSDPSSNDPINENPGDDQNQTVGFTIDPVADRAIDDTFDLYSIDSSELVWLVDDVLEDHDPDWELYIEKGLISSTYRDDSDEFPEDDDEPDILDELFENCSDFQKDDFFRQSCALPGIGSAVGERLITPANGAQPGTSDIRQQLNVTYNDLVVSITGSGIQEFDGQSSENIHAYGVVYNVLEITKAPSSKSQYQKEEVSVYFRASDYDGREILSSDVLLGNYYLNEDYFTGVFGTISMQTLGYLDGESRYGFHDLNGSFTFETVTRSDAAIAADAGSEKMLKLTSGDQVMCVFNSDSFRGFVDPHSHKIDNDCDGISE